jgi:antitoxin ParD1/3/4
VSQLGRHPGTAFPHVDLFVAGRRARAPDQELDDAGRGPTVPWSGVRVGFSLTEQWGLVMRTTRQLSITLPNDMADALRERVRSGEYASESEVIREGLRALFARDQAVEAWLREEVAAAYDAVVAEPSRAVTAQTVRARLAAEQAGSE